MTKTIILTSENVINDGLNNKMKYTFPTPVTFKDDMISVAKINMYYSWYNISSAHNNNQFSYLFPGESEETVVNIPDSHMEITSLNAYLQSIFVSNGPEVHMNQNGAQLIQIR